MTKICRVETCQYCWKSSVKSPADLLTVDEILKLHSVLADEASSLGDRLFSGHFPHLFSRSRWSDLVSITGLFLDADAQYLELSTRWHRGRSAEMKARLPMVSQGHRSGIGQYSIWLPGSRLGDWRWHLQSNASSSVWNCHSLVC